MFSRALLASVHQYRLWVLLCLTDWYFHLFPYSKEMLLSCLRSSWLLKDNLMQEAQFFEGIFLHSLHGFYCLSSWKSRALYWCIRDVLCSDCFKGCILERIIWLCVGKSFFVNMFAAPYWELFNFSNKIMHKYIMYCF